MFSDGQECADPASSTFLQLHRIARWRRPPTSARVGVPYSRRCRQGLWECGLQHAALDQNHRTVNDLNVFPVPDGDTGTNMLLTMRSAYKRIQDSDENHVGRLAQELSHGALMGARGNSGVILSQIWRGLAKGLNDKDAFDAFDLAAALTEASDTAYKGVMRPVEGTILTVIREGAEEANDAITKSVIWYNNILIIVLKVHRKP